VLSGKAIKLIEESPLQKVVIADTIPTEGKNLTNKFEVITVSHLFGEAIKRIHNEESVSILFE
jgi:ribose-phosphate pyrophosphokinase